MSGQVATEAKVVFGIQEILKILPHRYPFLMLDKVIEFEDSQRCVGIKNVTMNEPFFTGHFPNRPVMPGVMIIEAMAQTAAVLAHRSTDGVMQGKTVFLVGVDEVKFKRQVIPGDVLRLELTSEKRRRPLWIMKAQVTVGDKLVASGTISAVESD